MRSASSRSINCGTGGPHCRGLLHTPVAVVGEEGVRVRRQMIADGDPLAGSAARADARPPADSPGRSPPRSVARSHSACRPGRTAPSRSTRSNWDVAVAMHRDAMPGAEIRRDRRQRRAATASRRRTARAARRGWCRGCARRLPSSPSCRTWAFRSARSRKLRGGRKLPLTYLTPARRCPSSADRAGGHGSILKP